MAEQGLGREISPGVWLRPPGTATVSDEIVAALAAEARAGDRVARLLLHDDAGDPLHQMLIAHPRGMKYMPHRSNQGIRSYHLVDGEKVMILFDADGRIFEHFVLRDAGRGGPFLTRFAGRRYHAMIVLSEVAVFVETSPGPFGGTEYPMWAPAQDSAEAAEYRRRLFTQVGVRLPD